MKYYDIEKEAERADYTIHNGGLRETQNRLESLTQSIGVFRALSLGDPVSPPK